MLLLVQQILADATKHYLGHIYCNQSITETSNIKYLEVFEENYSCLILATKYHYRSNTKHLTIKCHHFKDKLLNINVEILKIDKRVNWSYIFNKYLDIRNFETIRKLIKNC